MHRPIVGGYDVDDRVAVERTMRCAELQGKFAAARLTPSQREFSPNLLNECSFLAICDMS